METVPERFRDRRFHVHNETVTLMRTTPAENAVIGARMAEVLGRSRGKVRILLPLLGVSAIDVLRHPFHDPDANATLFEAIRAGLLGCAHAQVIETDLHINDPEFAEIACTNLLELM